MRMGLGSQNVLYGAGDWTPNELAPPSFHYPPVQGVWVEQSPMGRAHASVGLHVRRFANTSHTPTSLLGAKHVHLQHPENPEDTGSPGYHLLDEFPLNFVRSPYE